MRGEIEVSQELSLACTLQATLERLKSSQLAKELFGHEFIEGYVASKALELSSFFDEITPWERHVVAARIQESQCLARPFGRLPIFWKVDAPNLEILSSALFCLVDDVDRLGSAEHLSGLRLAADQVDSLWVGALMAANYFGLVLGGKIGHRLIGRVGHIRAYATCAGIV